MTDKEKLEKVRAEIKRLRKEVKDNIAELGNSESERIGLFKDLEIYDNILSLIDSIQKEPVSEDLENEIENFLDYSNLLAPIREVEFIARHFANWQKQQMMKKAVDGQLEYGEDYLRIKCLSMSCQPQDDGTLVKLIIIKQRRTKQ